jgi:flagellar biosynthesis protein FlhF
MQVKVFEAVDMPTGLKMVKEDLGPDALILSTRTIRNGKLGMLGKPTLEITAAIDSPWPEENEPARPVFSPSAAAMAGDRALTQETLTYQDIWARAAEEEKSSDTGYTRPVEQEPLSGDTDSLSREIRELKQIIDSLSRRMVQQDTSPRTHPGPTHPGTAQMSGDSDPVVQLLLARGLNPQVAGLVARFTGDLLAPGDSGKETPHAILSTALAKLFTVSPALAGRPGQQKRISLIGPTGAGKTTTIAKLAAGYLSKYGGKVALVTIDTYRIAAVEQLKVYGEIMGLPVEVVINPRDMAQALSRHNDCDLILIDTAGRSPANGLEIAEMGAFLRPEFAIENQLLLPATNREAELETIVSQFSCLPVDSVIFSKVDECCLLGVLLNIHYSLDIPISYLTNGQRVPEDIIAATPAILAESIMNPSAVKNNG